MAPLDKNTQLEEDVVPLVGHGAPSKPNTAHKSRLRRLLAVLLVLTALGCLWLVVYKDEEEDTAMEDIETKTEVDGVDVEPLSSDAGGSESTIPPAETDAAPSSSESQADAGPTSAIVESPVGSESIGTVDGATSHTDVPVDGQSSTNSTSASSSQAWGDAAPSSDSPDTAIKPDNGRTGPLLGHDVSIAAMQANLAEARRLLLAEMERDYGPGSMETIFAIDGDFIGRIALQPAAGDESSLFRLRRKLMMKLLRVQLAAEDQRRGLRNRQLHDDASSLPLIPFVWATGGHSASAGHGNLFNESYTAVLERVLQPVFASTGLDFVGRNYAMGGMASAPALALCVDAVYGMDIDVLSWDFGMTDGGNIAAMEVYFRHAGMNPGRPACVGLFIEGRFRAAHVQVLSDLQEAGLSALYLDHFSDVVDKIPDTFGLTVEQAADLPPFVRDFKCDKKVEKGDPSCGDHKFTSSICPTRKFKTSWHPGWKWHALVGNILAFSLMELLDDALQELATGEPFDARALLAELVAEEDSDYDLFAQSAVSESSLAIVPPDQEEDLDASILFQKRGICHTALLPAETRFQGILTESSGLEMGLSRSAADSSINEGEMLRLVYDSADRQNCSVPLNQDFKDYWYLRHAEGPKKMVLPNDAELAAYGNGEPLQGLVAFCLGHCSWGRCRPDDVREDGIEEGEAVIQVNGVQATNVTEIQSCAFLRHARGHYWPLNSDGRLELTVEVAKEGSSMRFGTFLVW